MTRQCCTGGTASRRLAAAFVPGVLLALLPKCPLCLAAWLTVATGVSFPVSGVTWLRAILAMLCVSAVAMLVRARRVSSNQNRTWTLAKYVTPEPRRCSNPHSHPI
jgi:drug/metabolite transporter (DMT)-like permease